MRKLMLLLALAAWAFVLASLIGFDPADPPSHLVWPPNQPVANWCGPFGAALAYYLYKLLGLGVWMLVIFGGLGLLSAAAGQPVKHAAVRFLGLVMLAGAAAGFQHVLFPNSGPIANLSGGELGVVGTNELYSRFGMVGTVLWLAAIALIGGIVAMDEWITASVSWMWKRGVPAAVAAGKTAGVAAGTAAVEAGKVTARGGGTMVSRLWARMFSFSRLRENDIDDDARLIRGVGRGAGAPPVGGRKGRAASQLETKEISAAAIGVADPDEESMVATAVESDENGAPARAPSRSSAKAGGKAAGRPAGKAGGPAIDGDADDQADEIGEFDAESDDEESADHEERLPVVDEDEEDEEEIEVMRPTPAAAKNKGAPVPDEDEEDHELPGAPQVFSEAKLREKINKLPILFGQGKKQVATDADLKGLQGAPEAEPAEGSRPYQFPGLDLLENPEENFNAKLEEHVREQATALEYALKQYRIDGEVVGIESGPVITLYDVRLAPGTKVAAISAVSSDIARALKAVNVRIVPNTAGRDTIGIEVPNAQKEKVRLKELMSKSEKFASMRLPMFLGKDASGEPLIEDLVKMPHMLIAGTTGSGKSVCMNTIIMGFLYTKKPSELKMVLVDPKMVEMSQFKDIPHLMCPVVTEMGKAAAILEWACAKMDERYELLAEAGCRDIAGYNDLSWDELKDRIRPSGPQEEAKIPRKLPYMVFIIDELADLMMTAKEVESHIIRIAQKARAVGIHLILATQRPQANVVTGLIKSNMPCRVSFKVASGMDSRIVLDQKGGELLLGHGDMLFLSPRSSKLARAQGTLVDDAEIRRVVRFMRDIAAPSFERSLMSLRRSTDGDDERLAATENNSSASLAAAQEDPLFPRAVEIVLETKRGSVSLLQRRLAIGYTRASRLIDLMGIAGIISDHKGSVARDVLISPEEWAAMKKLAAEKGLLGEPEQGELFGAKGNVVSGSEPEETGEASDDVEQPEHAPFDVADDSDDVDDAGDADDVDDDADVDDDEVDDDQEEEDADDEEFEEDGRTRAEG